MRPRVVPWLVTLRTISRLALPCLAACASDSGHEPLVGGPSENWEAVFEGLPSAIPERARIAPESEPGEPLHIEGLVTHLDGTPAPGTIVYAYHTDARGIYPTDERYRGREAYRHGRLRSWARADSSGRYRFDTIRPAGYPDSDEPQHVHMHVIEPGRCTDWIDSIWFQDDPRLTPQKIAQHDRRRGGSGIARPTRDGAGAWQVTRDIRLGEHVPGYPAEH